MEDPGTADITSGGRLPFERRLRLEAAARRVLDTLAGSPSTAPSPGPVDLPDNPRIGVILQWGIGDAVLTLPLLTGLRSAFPSGSIELIGKPWLKSLFAGAGLADATHDLVPPWTRHSRKYRPGSGAWRRYLSQLRSLRRAPFDLLVSCRFDARDILQLRILRANLRAGYGAAGGAGWLNIDLGTPPSRADGTSVYHDAACALERLTGETPPSRPCLPVPPSVAEAALSNLREAGYDNGPLVALSMSAGHPIRRWPPERFNQVIQRVADNIGFLVVIRDQTDNVVSELAVPEQLPHVEWSGELQGLAGLLSIVDVTLCCDSGVMHLASAVGSDVVAIFGPGSLDWYGPSGLHDRAVFHDPMPCRPCFDNCIYARPLCMEAVSVEMVSAALLASLRSRNNRSEVEL